MSNKITPKIDLEKKHGDFNKLGEGEFFIWDGELWVVSFVDDQCAVCISNLSRGVSEGFCDKEITLVDVEITWKCKTNKNKKGKAKK